MFLNKLFNNFKKKGWSGLLMMPMNGTNEWTETKHLQSINKSVYVFSCVRKIAEKIAGIEFKLYKIKNSKGELMEILDHPLLDLLENPNPFFDRDKLIMLKQMNQELTGDAYWYKIMVGNQVKELWPLRSDWVKIVPDSTNYIKKYIYRIPGGLKDQEFLPEEIIHFCYPSPLTEFENRTGLSPITPAQNRIDTEEFATKYNRDFFLNNGRPDGVLQTDGTLSEDQYERMREMWSKKYKGVGKNSQLAFLEGGLKYTQIAFNQTDMDYINGLKATRDDILTVFGVPKTIVAVTDDVNLANAESGVRVFLSETMKPKFKSFVATLNKYLVPYFGKDLWLDCVDPSPENRDQILKEYQNGSDNGWLTPNEIRILEGLPPIDGGDDPLAFQRLETFALGFNRFNKKTLLLGQPVISKDYLSGKGDLKRELEIKELETKLQKQYKVKMEKDLIKTKELETIRRTNIWNKYNEKVKEHKVITLKELRRFFEGQQNRIDRAINKDFSDRKKGKNLERHIKAIMNNFDWDNENHILMAMLESAAGIVALKTGQEALKDVGAKVSFVLTSEIKHWIEHKSKLDANFINATTEKKLLNQFNEAIQAGENITQIKDRVKNVFDIRKEGEARRIARTETHGIMNYATNQAYKETDVVVGKEWISVPVGNFRPEHFAIDGQIVRTDEKFLVDGELLDFPGDPSGSAENTINCRCGMAPKVIID